MEYTQFRFFKNTPLIDFQNTIHFDSNSARDSFFLQGNHYPELPVDNVNFNFVRDRSTIDLNVSYNSMRGVNYCTFQSGLEGVRYYAYVAKYEYLNDNAVRVYLIIDGIMTFTQGTTLESFTNLTVQRQHLTLSNYNANIWELKNNEDIIKTFTKSYFKTETVLFDELIVLIKSSADLRANFGNVDDPKIKTSSGKQFDGITSPLNLYACDLDDFNLLMEELSGFAWISQNITSLSLIPKIFLDGNLTNCFFDSTMSLAGFTGLYNVTGTKTSKSSLLTEIQAKSYTMPQTLALFDLDPVQDKHLLRNEYTTSEVYNYSGGQFFVDNGQLNPAYGLAYAMDIVTGHNTEMKLYIENYRNATTTGLEGGSYVNDGLVYNQFDDIPMLINNFDLAMSKNANQRALAESKLITNKAKTITDPNANLKDRFFAAASLVSKISPSDLFGKFHDEHDFYNQQKAEMADMALETPTITQQTTGNSFNIANKKFGIHFKYSKPSFAEMTKIRKYYKLFGYQVNQNGVALNKIDSMNVCNYVQFSGSWFINDVDVSIIEMMKAQFENGVRLWHNNGTRNPMTQSVQTNIMIK